MKKKERKENLKRTVVLQISEAEDNKNHGWEALDHAGMTSGALEHRGSLLPVKCPHSGNKQVTDKVQLSQGCYIHTKRKPCWCISTIQCPQTHIPQWHDYKTSKTRWCCFSCLYGHARSKKQMLLPWTILPFGLLLNPQRWIHKIRTLKA